MNRMVDRTSGPVSESCGLPPRSVGGCQQLAIEQPIKTQATFGNIVTAVYSVACGVWPPGLVQYPLPAIAPIIPFAFIGSPASASTRAAASRALIVFVGIAGAVATGLVFAALALVVFVAFEALVVFVAVMVDLRKGRGYPPPVRWRGITQLQPVSETGKRRRRQFPTNSRGF